MTIRTMSRMCPVLVVLLAGLAAITPLSAAEPPADKKPKSPDCTGFRGLKWGQDARTVKGLTFDYKNDGLAHHHRKRDNLAIGEARLFSIVYSFYSGRLARVSVTIDKAHDMDKVKAVLVAKYGKPQKSEKGHGKPQRWIWEFKDARITLIAGRRYQGGATRPVLQMDYLPLFKQKEKDDADAAAESKGDL